MRQVWKWRRSLPAMPGRGSEEVAPVGSATEEALSREVTRASVHDLRATCTSTQTASPNSASSRTFTVWGTKR